MTSVYTAWITDWNNSLPSGRTCFGMCREASGAMAEAFPELRQVKGHVYDTFWGKRAHWWCVAPEGEIVDPTATQFPALERYEEYRAGDKVCVGVCMDCGTKLWADPTIPYDSRFCSKRCEDATINYLNGF